MTWAIKLDGVIITYSSMRGAGVAYRFYKKKGRDVVRVYKKKDGERWIPARQLA